MRSRLGYSRIKQVNLTPSTSPNVQHVSKRKNGVFNNPQVASGWNDDISR